MRVIVWKETGALHEMLRDVEPGELLARAVASGIDPDLVEEIEVTPEEYRARFEPAIDHATVLAAQIRRERESRILAVRWRIERHQDEILLGANITEPIEPLLQYIQALRDVPNQEGFPHSIEWPSIKEGT